MSLSERFNEHPILHWIADNTKNFLYLVLIIAAVGVLAYRLLSHWSAQAGYNYGVAENDYVELRAKSGEEQEATVGQLLQIIEEQPDLQAVYDGKLAQTLLIQGDAEIALPLMERAIARTEGENLPLYTLYAENTLLIAKGDYAEALKRTEELQRQIPGADAGSILLPLNTLRIAMLQNKLGLKEEAATWAVWKEHAEDTGFQQIASVFKEAKMDLNDYIEARENFLK